MVCPPDTDTPGLAFEKTLRPPETDVVAGNIKAIAPERRGRGHRPRASRSGRYLIIPGVAVASCTSGSRACVPGLFFAITDGDVAKARKQRLAAASATPADERA